MDSCDKCLPILKRHGILPPDVKSVDESTADAFLKKFKRWSTDNHPDKGGDLATFQQVSSCVDYVIKDLKCRGFPFYYVPSPPRGRSPPKSSTKEKPCEDYYAEFSYAYFDEVKKIFEVTKWDCRKIDDFAELITLLLYVRQGKAHLVSYEKLYDAMKASKLEIHEALYDYYFKKLVEDLGWKPKTKEASPTTCKKLYDNFVEVLRDIYNKNITVSDVEKVVKVLNYDCRNIFRLDDFIMQLLYVREGKEIDEYSLRQAITKANLNTNYRTDKEYLQYIFQQLGWEIRRSPSPKRKSPSPKKVPPKRKAPKRKAPRRPPKRKAPKKKVPPKRKGPIKLKDSSSLSSSTPPRKSSSSKSISTPSSRSTSSSRSASRSPSPPKRKASPKRKIPSPRKSTSTSTSRSSSSSRTSSRTSTSRSSSSSRSPSPRKVPKRKVPPKRKVVKRKVVKRKPPKRKVAQPRGSPPQGFVFIEEGSSSEYTFRR